MRQLGGLLEGRRILGGLRPDEFKPRTLSRNEVVKEGLDLYTKGATSREMPLMSHLRDVRGIREEVAYEQAHEDRWLVYYEIDVEKNRAYFHRVSGGSQAKEYRPEEPGRKQLTRSP